MTRLGVAWGFLACNFAGASTALFVGSMYPGLGVATGLAAAWCFFLALLEWQPDASGGGE